MPIDISRIKSRLASIEEGNRGQSAGNQNMIKLPKGKHVIRIVPYKLNKNMPFQELWFHYGIGKKNFLCPKRMEGSDCPICDFTSSVWNDFKSTNDDQYKEIFKQVIAKFRVYVPIIVRSSPDETIVFGKGVTTAKWWGIAEKTYKEILDEVVSADADGQDVLDVESGLDFTVTMDNFAGRTDRFQVSSIKCARKTSRLIDGTEDDIKELIDSIVPINEMFTFNTLEEMKEALVKHANSSEDSSVPSAGTTKDFRKSDKNITDEVDSKLDALLDDEDKE